MARRGEDADTVVLGEVGMILGGEWGARRATMQTTAINRRERKKKKSGNGEFENQGILNEMVRV